MEEVPDGPYLAVAVFCKQQAVDAGSLPSIEGIWTAVTVPLAEPPPDVYLVVMLRCGEDAGDAVVGVKCDLPHGGHLYMDPIEFRFSGPYAGCAWSGKVSLQGLQSGLYRYTLTLNGRFLTCIPLRLVVEQAKGAEKSWLN